MKVPPTKRIEIIRTITKAIIAPAPLSHLKNRKFPVNGFPFFYINWGVVTNSSMDLL
jgi:hypothetical protein